MGSFSHKKIAANIEDYPVTPWRGGSPAFDGIPHKEF